MPELVHPCLYLYLPFLGPSVVVFFLSNSSVTSAYSYYNFYPITRFLQAKLPSSGSFSLALICISCFLPASFSSSLFALPSTGLFPFLLKLHKSQQQENQCFYCVLKRDTITNVVAQNFSSSALSKDWHHSHIHATDC